jgi:hypothetical protein
MIVVEAQLLYRLLLWTRLPQIQVLGMRCVFETQEAEHQRVLAWAALDDRC